MGLAGLMPLLGCPVPVDSASKSGLMNKHIVKHIVYKVLQTYRDYFVGFGWVWWADE